MVGSAGVSNRVFEQFLEAFSGFGFGFGALPGAGKALLQIPGLGFAPLMAAGITDSVGAEFNYFPFLPFLAIPAHSSNRV